MVPRQQQDCTSKLEYRQASKQLDICMLEIR